MLAEVGVGAIQERGHKPRSAEVLKDRKGKKVNWLLESPK